MAYGIASSSRVRCADAHSAYARRSVQSEQYGAALTHFARLLSNSGQHGGREIPQHVEGRLRDEFAEGAAWRVLAACQNDGTTWSSTRRQWREGGAAGVASKGSPGRPRLSDAQVARLERELERGPLAHGWADQRWTLARVKKLIGRLFHISYTVEGTWRLLKRHGWSWQQPARRAIERDDDAVELWKKEVWPRVRAPRRPAMVRSSSRTRPASR
ncbi:winged helix-turn-helix domain-containing protein [Streptomyces hyaluromycini]|uniref:Winged helix-turn-helix domain-containing protein n=1 Tax=Streptomyces hyaluromycini TaxID=1377993 RepID=A0ABV1X4I0_9ACTN